jgi:hypothetical protein
MRQVSASEGKRIVEAGYDAMATRYLEWSGPTRSSALLWVVGHAPAV